MAVAEERCQGGHIQARGAAEEVCSAVGELLAAEKVGMFGIMVGMDLKAAAEEEEGRWGKAVKCT